MKTEQTGGKTPFEQAAKVRRELSKMAETIGVVEMNIPTWLAAILSGFRKEILEKTGILMVPSRNDIKIVVSQDKYSILREAFSWAGEDEKSQNKVLSDLYIALFRVIQASATSGVNVDKIVKPHRNLIRISADNFPPFEGLVEFLEEGGKLTDIDQQNLTGVVSAIFYHLEEANHPKVLEWKTKGLTPDKIFTIPD